MAPQIAHKHHRGHEKLALSLWGSCIVIKRYTIRLPFVGTRSTEEAGAIPLVWVRSEFEINQYLRRLSRCMLLLYATWCTLAYSGTVLGQR